MDEHTAPPDYKALLGKKVLKCEGLSYEGVDIGSLVLVFEAVKADTFGEVEVRGMEWRVVPPTHRALCDMYKNGIYKLIGVGLVMDEFSYDSYMVAVQDDVLAQFSFAIPF